MKIEFWREKPNSGTKKTDFKNESGFEIVILRGVISAFYRPTSVNRKNKLGFGFLLLKFENFNRMRPI